MIGKKLAFLDDGGNGFRHHFFPLRIADADLPQNITGKDVQAVSG